MLCTVQVSAKTASEVARLLTAYGINLDSFLRSNLNFLELVMPTISGIAERARGSAQPDFATDFSDTVLPCLRYQSEFRRVGAHIDDMILRLRAQRLEVEAMRQGPRKPAGPRRFESLANPRRYLSESEQFLDESELAMLGRVGAKRGHPYLYMPGPHAATSACRAGTTLNLNPDGRSLAGLRGMQIGRVDIERWLTLLQYYGLVPLTLSLGVAMTSDDGAAIKAAFSVILSQITEVVCFLFGCNQALAQVSYREDMVAIHERGLRLAAGWERAHLETEVAIHQCNGHSEAMTRALLIMASGASADEDIYGDRMAVPGLAARTSDMSMAPDPSEFPSLPVLSSDNF